MKFRKTDAMMPAIGLITGLAVGAVLGVLFSSRKGSSTRDLLKGKLVALFNGSETSKVTEVKYHVIEDLRAHHKEVADQLEDKAHEITITALKQTGPKSRQVPVAES
jgi:gas vesicle protein